MSTEASGSSSNEQLLMQWNLQGSLGPAPPAVQLCLFIPKVVKGSVSPQLSMNAERQKKHKNGLPRILSRGIGHEAVKF